MSFFTWLLALAFEYLHDLAAQWRAARLAVAGALRVALAAAVYQVRSYHRHPMFDTGLTPLHNWRVLTAALARHLGPGDRLVAADFETRSTVSFTRPLAEPVLLREELAGFDAGTVCRFLYLNLIWDHARRVDMTYRMSLVDLTAVREVRLPYADGSGVVPDRQLVIFERPADIP
jgi:hypothetical protein